MDDLLNTASTAPMSTQGTVNQNPAQVNSERFLSPLTPQNSQNVPLSISPRLALELANYLGKLARDSTRDYLVVTNELAEWLKLVPSVNEELFFGETYDGQSKKLTRIYDSKYGIRKENLEKVNKAFETQTEKSIACEQAFELLRKKFDADKCNEIIDRCLRGEMKAEVIDKLGLSKYVVKQEQTKQDNENE